MSDKKVCEVCGREAALCRRCTVPNYAAAWPTDWQAVAECYRLGFERERAKAAILTPEVLRLIEAGRKYSTACKEFHALPFDTRGATRRALNLRAEERASELRVAAIALPAEKPAESNHTEKQQLPKKGAG